MLAFDSLVLSLFLLLTYILFAVSLVTQNITLEVNPDSDILSAKERLVKKVALMDAAAASTKSNCGTPSNNSISSLMCVLWMALTTASKLQASDLYLIHNGKPLDDDALWMDYYFLRSNNGTVSVQPRVRGGCFMISASVLAMLCTAVVGSTCTCGLSLIAVPFLLPLLFVLPLFCL